MKRRYLIAAVSALALAAAALSLNLAGNRNLASRTATLGGESAAPSTSNSGAAPNPHLPLESAPSAEKASRAADASPGALPTPDPPQVSGLQDVDPHKAFGSKNAPIAMEVFSDFQCPACKQLYKTTNQQLLDNYVNTNKVYLVHRDFPLPMHAHSRTAAKYARAAAELGKAEPAEQALFQNQEKWEQTGDVDGILAAVFSSADMTKIRTLAKGTSLDVAIEKDVALGKSDKVNQTPTTIIHYKGQTYPVVGIVSYDVLRSFLDQLLSQR